MYMKSQASKSSTGPTTPDFDPVLDMIRGTPLETLWKWMFGGYLGLSIYASIVLVWHIPHFACKGGGGGSCTSPERFSEKQICIEPQLDRSRGDTNRIVS
jgi:hypothetical protein